MKKLNYSVILFNTLFLTQILAQTGWFQMNRMFASNDFQSIIFIDASVGYAVSDEGNLFKTTDAGNTWTANLESHFPLNDVFFIDNVGFIVGDEGMLLKTIDGTNWTRLYPGTETKLRAIFFYDIDNGYIFGDNSTILKTTDVGTTWQQLNTNPFNWSITDGIFITPEIGFATTMNNALMSTVDSGNSWQWQSFTYFPSEYLSINFVNDNVGYITGFEYDIGVMLKTTDSGLTWNSLQPQILSAIYSSIFFSADTGLVTADWGIILKTYDGGETWENIPTISEKSLFSGFIINENTCYAVGEDSTIIMSTNRGESWDLLGSPHTVDMYDIYFPTDSIGYSVGYNGFILKTTDLGNHWFQQESPTQQHLVSIYFINAETGFAGGSEGELLLTLDGGSTWEVHNDSQAGQMTFYSIKFFDDQTGVITGLNYLLKTMNGGTDWSKIYTGIYSRDVCFLTEDTIISVGSEGKIFKSLDGGISWTEKNSGTVEYLTAVEFINDMIGYAVGWNGILIKSTDSGETWFAINTNTNERFWDIEFSTDSTGYAVGNDGTILYTNDSGNNWSFQDANNYHRDLRAIQFTTDKTGYIVGFDGTMLKTNDGGVVTVEINNNNPISSFRLFQNYPNPFNSITTISFTLPELTVISLKLYNLLGEEITTVYEGEKSAGYHSLKFDASELSSGVYIYRIITSNYIESKKLVLLK